MSPTRAAHLEACKDIELISKNLLVGAKAFGKFPTQVDQVVLYSELAVDQEIDLSALHEGFFQEKYRLLKGVARKLVGMVDLHEKVIYLDQKQPAKKKSFVMLHEVGHAVLPWQRDTFLYLDDKSTIDQDTKELFEQEASFLASCLLFQNGVFEDEASILELSIKAPMLLADKFGSSHHAAIRRYVLSNPKRCAVLIFNAPLPKAEFSVPLRNCFESPSFITEFGELIIEEVYGMDFRFVQEISRKRRLHTDGKVQLMTSQGGLQSFDYHFYCNFYNTFVLIMPPGEKKLLGRKIVVAT
jgi:hypothetical protein